ncbi:hypothetical protein DZC72_04235 [Maribacter algicola]|uniref:Uncharacterized protein n=1 Tax=Maribacter algicola TaxID=2498892 RepID=A0A3R8R4I5_9FLAO|nr:hypothetical protein DZC72_04235 [Maribacter algicola]
MDSFSIQLDEYLLNINNYIFQNIIYLQDGFQFESKLLEDLDSCNVDTSKHSGSIYKYILFEDIQLVKMGFWEENNRVDFLFNLVELIDVTDKFSLVKKLYRYNGPFILKVKHALRNIGVHPIQSSNLKNIRNSIRDLDWSHFLKYYD